jgi:hypothetical protein
MCGVAVHMCGVAVHMCGVAGHMCGVAGHMCGVAGHNRLPCCLLLLLLLQCHISAPKRYLHSQLPDSHRLTAWWTATTAAVAAVATSGRQPRVLLLGAKAGLLAVAAVRAGAVHVTCVEQ